jgi:hypothetical protein
MADDQESSSGGIPGLMQEFIAQLRGLSERLEGVTGIGVPSVPPLSSLPVLRSLPVPGALTAAQLNALATTVSAQRRSVQAMKTQLTAFDEQLAVFERILSPLAEWSHRWAQLEDWLMNLRLGPAAEGQAGDS